MDSLVPAGSGLILSCKQDSCCTRYSCKVGPRPCWAFEHALSILLQKHVISEVHVTSPLTSLQILFSSRWVWGFIFFFFLTLFVWKAFVIWFFYNQLPQSRRKFLPLLLGLHMAKDAIINYISLKASPQQWESLLAENRGSPASL